MGWMLPWPVSSSGTLEDVIEPLSDGSGSRGLSVLQIRVGGGDGRRRRREILRIIRIGQQTQSGIDGRRRRRQRQGTRLDMASVNRFVLHSAGRHPFGRRRRRILFRQRAVPQLWRCRRSAVDVTGAAGADGSHRPRFAVARTRKRSAAGYDLPVGRMLADWSDVTVLVASLTPAGLVEGLVTAVGGRQ